MERDSFVFYRSFLEATEGLPADIRLEVYDTILRYGINGIEPKNLSPYANLAFTLIKPILEANNKRYENGKKGGESGKKGGRPKKEKPQNNPKITPKKPQENPIKTPNEDVDVDVNEDVDEKEDVEVFKKGDINISKSEPEIKESPQGLSLESPELEQPSTQQSDRVAERKEKSCAKKEKKQTDAEWFVQELIVLGVDVQTAEDFVKSRRAKRAAFTRTVIKGIIRQAAIARLTVGQAVEIATERGWQTFTAEYYLKSNKTYGGNTGNTYQEQKQQLLDNIKRGCEQSLQASENGTYVSVLEIPADELPF